MDVIRARTGEEGHGCAKRIQKKKIDCFVDATDYAE